LGIRVAVAADILSLTLLTPPGEWGADIVIGTSQRFGVPMGYGGPHAAFFAAKENYKRFIPGRIIGISKDAHENDALRMALQTREQHIKREKATSNICTAQVLLSVMASMYAVYHGAAGLKFIATKIHNRAVSLEKALKSLGYNLTNSYFFDTLKVEDSIENITLLRTACEQNEINLNYFEEGIISISINETTSNQDIVYLIDVFANIKDKKTTFTKTEELRIPTGLVRTSSFLTAEVFNKHHTETALMRYIKKLERKDLSLTHSMIALGSCTMKLNAATQLLPLSWSEFGNIHPFVPKNQALGYQELIENLAEYLSTITGFHATSLQPNSGAQGEYAGLMVIKAFHDANNDHDRNVVLIPESAHGTNPASAVLAGMKVVVVKNTAIGEVDIVDLKTKAELHKETLSCLMITYPSTYGVFDDNIKDVTKIIHSYGAQIYMDGANMNAQVGFTSPAEIGADVCHLNLHKTFAIPHGGGGPGVGPICVAKHLAPFLPTNANIETGGENALEGISAAPYGSAFILPISYSYIRTLGESGLKSSTETAILNANYLKTILCEHYDVLYQNKNGRVAHEMIIDCRKFKPLGIEVVDIAKRLIDYGYHAPTVSFPVAGTLMIEPTESESKDELDRFASALIGIRKEIEEIIIGDADSTDNVLKNAPHSLDIITADEWSHTYTRNKAAYPLEWIKDNKFWASVSRINDSYGDRNLICTCPSIEEYQD
jgi:glycine dehydrogenase